MNAVAEFAGSAVSVLADWEDDVPGEASVLVVFERWETVRALYALVGSQETSREAESSLEGHRRGQRKVFLESARPCPCCAGWCRSSALRRWRPSSGSTRARLARHRRTPRR